MSVKFCLSGQLLKMSPSGYFNMCYLALEFRLCRQFSLISLIGIHFLLDDIRLFVNQMLNTESAGHMSGRLVNDKARVMYVVEVVADPVELIEYVR